MVCARIPVGLHGSFINFLCAEMSERETVLSAIEAVILLNEEAGVNNESLALVRAVSEGRQKVDFDLFCKDIMTCILIMVVWRGRPLTQNAREKGSLFWSCSIGMQLWAQDYSTHWQWQLS